VEIFRFKMMDNERIYKRGFSSGEFEVSEVQNKQNEMKYVEFNQIIQPSPLALSMSLVPRRSMNQHAC
jgi:hypothetical protein